uniref:Uncharacterized protein n=1 Tax=Plectus sambesii TaxID=2011161 RepID=A0A914V9Y6_9BILA
MAIAVGLTAIRQTIQLKLCLFQLPTDGHSCLDYFHHSTATLSHRLLCPSDFPSGGSRSLPVQFSAART